MPWVAVAVMSMAAMMALVVAMDMVGEGRHRAVVLPVSALTLGLYIFWGHL